MDPKGPGAQVDQVGLPWLQVCKRTQSLGVHRSELEGCATDAIPNPDILLLKTRRLSLSLPTTAMGPTAGAELAMQNGAPCSAEAAVGGVLR